MDTQNFEESSEGDESVVGLCPFVGVGSGGDVDCIRRLWSALRRDGSCPNAVYFSDTGRLVIPLQCIFQADVALHMKTSLGQTLAA